MTLTHGVALAGPHELDAFEALVGMHVDQLTYFRSVKSTINFRYELAYMTSLYARHTTPVLTLQIQGDGSGGAQPAFALARILAGDHDGVLTSWASVMAAQKPKSPVLRLFHEGNGDWYPWGCKANGNTPALYVAAWRHIHALFRRHDATNVRFLWSPNKIAPGLTPFAEFYPGDAYVAQVGLSGYNGGTAVNRGGWRSFTQVFGPSLTALGTVAPTKPIYITETGCVEQGGTKSMWLANMWAQADAWPSIRGLTYSHLVNGAADWRIDTSSAATAAYCGAALQATGH
jgi:hypothetical protein